jgi:hypothetical protein
MMNLNPSLKVRPYILWPKPYTLTAALSVRRFKRSISKFLNCFVGVDSEMIRGAALGIQEDDDDPCG